MKTLLVAINSKYIHSNLAVFCLKEYAKRNCCTSEIEIGEYTINQLEEDILRSIYEKKADILCFSVYIWNVGLVKKIIGDFHGICPDVPIWLGGPEVSFELEKTLSEFPGIKGIMIGEGERTFMRVMSAYEDISKEGGELSKSDEKLQNIQGIIYRKNNAGLDKETEAEELTLNCKSEFFDLSEVPFPYPDLVAGKGEKLDHKIVYYESSRGCPFSCSYCLSSVDKNLRFRDLKLVKKELAYFINAGVPQVKFVDRTFNCRKEHAKAIWRFIKENDNGISNFHFEIGADLIDEEELSLMSDMRPGLIQLEIGVQSTNESTLNEINRHVSFEKICNVVNRVKSFKNIHQHLDLIAGLPFEDLESFGHSFDDVYALRPDQLQLGFLKVLKGSLMYERKNEYGIVYSSSAPYEVLSTNWISYDDIILLKGVETVVELYYNSGQYVNTLEYAMHFWSRSFEFYLELADFYRKKTAGGQSLNRVAKYELLYDFICGTRPDIKKETAELLTIDLYLREPAKTRPDFSADLHELKDELSEAARKLWEEEGGESRTPYRQFLHDTHQELTDFDIELLLREGKSVYRRQIYHIDYRKKDPLSGNGFIKKI